MFGSGSQVDSKVTRVVVALAAIAIVFGIGVRSYRPDHRVFWDDEVYTTIKVLGLTEADLRARVEHANDARTVRHLFHPAAAEVHPDLIGTVRSLATDEPQHPPLYYFLAQVWTTLFGASVLSLRSLSVLFGILAIAATYLLGRELFGTRTAGLVAAALSALSPVEVIYAQEIREYEMWLVAILMTSYLFLRARRLTTLRAWLAYGVSLATALYVDPLTLLVAFAHGASILPSERTRRMADLRAYLWILSIAIATFVPWLAIIVGRRSQVHRSMATILDARISLGRMLRDALKLVRIDSADFDIEHRASLNLALTAIVVALIALAWYALITSGKLRQKWFIFTLLASTSLPIVLLDLLFGGKRIESSAYFIPSYVAIDLSIAFLFANSLSNVKASAGRATWLGLLAIVLSVRFGAIAASSLADMWWNDYNMRSIAMARAINESNRPLVASDAYLGFSLSVLEYVKPDAAVFLRPRCYLCETAVDRDDLTPILAHTDDSIFLIGPTPELLAEARAASEARRGRSYRCIHVRDSCKSDLNLY